MSMAVWSTGKMSRKNRDRTIKFSEKEQNVNAGLRMFIMMDIIIVIDLWFWTGFVKDLVPGSQALWNVHW